MTSDQRLFAASLRQDLPTLDLHGLYPSEALERLELFLYTTSEKDTAAKIIYGIGTGKLGEQVLAYLSKHPLVEHVIEQSGNCIILFYLP